MLVETKYRRINGPISFSGNQLEQEIAFYEPISARNSIPLTWKRASDFSVFDDHENKWIDFTSGIFVTNAGHANPQIIKAIEDQLHSELLFSYNYPTEIKRDFIKKLMEISPSYFEKIALLMTGSEAVDLAYKLVKEWGNKKDRKYIITFKGSYHGRGLSNDFICGSKEKAKWSGMEDDGVIFLDFPYDSSAQFDASVLPDANSIACFFLETFQGWGAWFYPDKFLKDLYAFARKAGALVCFDEMQAGFYRLGKTFGYMTYGDYLEPDLICVGKGMTSSLPVAGVLARREIMDIEASADMHGTHSGNTLCCAAGLANISYLSNPAFVQQLQEKIILFERELNSFIDFELVTAINVRGLIAGIIFQDASDATNIVKKCIEQGVLPVCTNRNSIKLAPPLTINCDALAEGLGVIKKIIAEYRRRN